MIMNEKRQAIHMDSLYHLFLRILERITVVASPAGCLGYMDLQWMNSNQTGSSVLAM